MGQGVAILIISPDGLYGLIDGGEANSGVVAYLRSLGIQELDWIVATHPHADHIGGLVDVLQTIPVRTVYTGGHSHTTITYERFLDAIISARAEYVEVKIGDSISLGNLSFTVLHPIDNTGDDLNNYSVVMHLEHTQASFLFTGDAEREAESSLLSSGMNLRADVLKVGHHGSRTSSTPGFLAQVKPFYTVYSAGKDNQYGHPHLETIEALTAAGVEIYGTSEHGTVIISTDGTSYRIEVERESQPRSPPTAEPVPTVEPAAAPFSLEIVSVTSPVSPGSRATLRAQTFAGASCNITVYYKSGPSTSQDLNPKNADSSGNLSWTWQVGSRTAPGNWRIVVNCRDDGSSLTRETTFEVR